MKKTLITAIVFLLLTVEGKMFALTLSGVDSVSYYHEYGFDFEFQMPCTTFTYDYYYGCVNHFEFYFDNMSSSYFISTGCHVQCGWGVQAGKVNLDSIKTAPPDSGFKLEMNIDSIPQDSLSSYVGNSYIIKTAVDPRYSCIFFAKIRILGFRVVDTATKRIVFRFLWACNVNSSRDISTSGLDTFNLPSTAISFGTTRKSINYSSGQRTFKVIGDKFIVPKEFIGTGAYINIYGLAGKRLNKIPITNNNVIDLRRIKGNTLGVVVVRVERQN